MVENLTKRFGQFLAVDDVSFSVGRGEVYGWLGPNGAGKTTTIRMLLGLLKPSEGSCRVLGYDPATQAKAMQARVGYMSQLFTLYNDLTAGENIRFYGQAYGLSPRELRRRQDEILQMAGLQGRENALTRDLSGGWKQRLALGCAIVHRPQVVFLDEPTAGVDPISRREFWALIYAMAGDGVTVLVTTHYMDEAELCQRVGFISQGRLVALDTPEQLKRTQMRGQVLEVDCSPTDAAMRVLLAPREGAPGRARPGRAHRCRSRRWPSMARRSTWSSRTRERPCSLSGRCWRATELWCRPSAGSRPPWRMCLSLWCGRDRDGLLLALRHAPDWVPDLHT